MESRQLRYFVAVAEELSFSRAAVRLNITQPPLSIQIKALEAELGTTLLNRTRHVVSLTEAGRVLLDRAREAVLRVDHAGEAVRRVGCGEAGRIRMGFVGSVPMLDVFSHLLWKFRERHPLVRIDLHHLSTDGQVRALVEERIDVAFIRPFNRFNLGTMLTVQHSWPDRLVAYFPAGHALAGCQEDLDLHDLAGEDFVGVSASVGCGVQQQTMALCAAAGFMPKLVQEANDLRTVLWLVAAGLGITLLPECYSGAGVANVVARPLLGLGVDSQVLMATRAAVPSLLLRRFVEHVAEIA